MLLSLFVSFAFADCGPLNLQDRKIQNLTSIRNESCINSTDSSYSGSATSLNWKTVNIANGNFENAVMNGINWLRSEVSATYFRKVTLNKAQLNDDNFQDLDLFRISTQEFTLQRSQFGGTGIEFLNSSQTDIIDSQMVGLDISKAQMSDTVFSNTQVRDSKFSDLSLVRTKISLSNWSQVSAQSLTIGNLSATGLNLDKLELVNSTIDQVDLINLQSTDLRIVGSRVTQLQVKGSQLRGLQILQPTTLFHLQITDSQLYSPTFKMAQFAYLTLQDVNIFGATFQQSSFADTHFNHVHFINCDLSDVQFLSGISFQNSTFDSATKFPAGFKIPDGLTLKGD